MLDVNYRVAPDRFLKEQQQQSVKEFEYLCEVIITRNLNRNDDC